MGSKVKTYTVEELIRLGALEKPLDGNHGGIHPKSSDFVVDGIPFIMASDMMNGGIDTKGCKFITEAQAKTLRKGFAKEGDVLISHKATIGRTAIVGKIKTEYIVLTPQVTYYRVKDRQQINPVYLKYYFDSIKFQNLLEQWAGGGSTRLYLGITGQLKLPIELPSIEVQDKIVSVISDYDLKLNLNRQINQTLEQMAQTLFKSWFVDFDPVFDNMLAKVDFKLDTSPSKCSSDLGSKLGCDFPDVLLKKAKKRLLALQDRALQQGCDLHALLAGDKNNIHSHFPSEFEFSEQLGWIPKGWEINALYDIAEYVNGAAYKKFEPNIEGVGLPIIKIAELKSGISEKTGFSTVLMPDKYKINDHDILFSWSGNPDTSIDTFEWSLGAAWLNQHIFKVIPNKSYERHFVFCLLKNMKPVFADIARDKQTTGLGHVTVKDLKRLQIIMPPKNVVESFNCEASNLLQKHFVQTKQNEQLTKLRDTLLPKLISGELQIPDVVPA